MKEYNLLTAKPVIFAANVTEDDLPDDGASNKYVASVREFAAKENCEVFVICAQIEQEISELDDDEKKMFLEDLGISSSGLDKLIAASYRILGLISYLTAGETETRAWTIVKGTKAPQAAGKIHSDFERGFIRAEVVNYQDLLDCGSYTAAKEKGLVGLEGKEYVVKDGDVILFRFNVYACQIPVLLDASDRHIFCFYISSLNFFTFSAASPLKTAEPATMMLAPASRAALTLSVLIPPSTSMSA